MAETRARNRDFTILFMVMLITGAQTADANVQRAGVVVRKAVHRGNGALLRKGVAQEAQHTLVLEPDLVERPGVKQPHLSADAVL